MLREDPAVSGGAHHVAPGGNEGVRPQVRSASNISGMKGRLILGQGEKRNKEKLSEALGPHGLHAISSNGMCPVLPLIICTAAADTTRGTRERQRDGESSRVSVRKGQE